MRKAILNIIEVAGAVCTMEGLTLAGPTLIRELTSAVEYATGLGIGMADLPYEAIEWYTEANKINDLV